MTNKQRVLGNALEAGVVARAVAKGIPSRKQPRSGELAEFPGDAVVGEFLAECKVRAATLDAKGQSVRLDLGWLRKVQEQAKRAGFRDGIVVVRPKGSERLLALLDFEVLLELLRFEAQARCVVESTQICAEEVKSER